MRVSPAQYDHSARPAALLEIHDPGLGVVVGASPSNVHAGPNQDRPPPNRSNWHVGPRSRWSTARKSPCAIPLSRTAAKTRSEPLQPSRFSVRSPFRPSRLVRSPLMSARSLTTGPCSILGLGCTQNGRVPVANDAIHSNHWAAAFLAVRGDVIPNISPSLGQSRERLSSPNARVFSRAQSVWHSICDYPRS